MGAFTELELDNMKNEFICIISTVKRPGIEKLIACFNNNDFFTAPASAQYHNAVKGGLLHHSLCTYKALVKLWELYKTLAPTNQKLMSINPESLIIVGLLHDLYKVNFYEPTVKCWKDDNAIGNQWRHYIGYKINNKFHCRNRVKSIVYIASCINLSASEYVALDWCQGFEEPGISTSAESTAELFSAMNDEPLLILLQMAVKSSTYLMEPLTDIKIDNEIIC